MIVSVLVFNNHAKVRLSKFYTPQLLSPARQQALVHRIFQLVSRRPDSACNFLDAPELDALLPHGTSRLGALTESGSGSNVLKKGSGSNAPASTASLGSSGHRALTGDDRLRVIYRHYATLYFVFVVDASESELGILDLIQVFVESLDQMFENVCELDLIFHFDEVHALLAEVVQGGLVLETNIREIVAQAKAKDTARKASAAASSTSSISSLAASASSLTGGAGLPWPPGNVVVSAFSSGVSGLARGIGSRLGR
ncbi:Sigma-adaptin 3A [Tilletia horrida]|uniref:Sigma-adaptin 3A n=1 Tax=Tilletia horrida TaxID=155126 RepID=A0AAN6G8W0_9BASI|nr:Sigma-adaptin 3A [Tilletia horrida]KAK0538629.1 Sigma-adaptin 3A [Tilletia horrida]KAK0539599.1 Sigma-adaptin 3A [Tilletia horrida]KAK0556179.1 Sigma-adaptin 3A [Tilletia horrida]